MLSQSKPLFLVSFTLNADILRPVIMWAKFVIITEHAVEWLSDVIWTLRPFADVHNIFPFLATTEWLLLKDRNVSLSHCLANLQLNLFLLWNLYLFGLLLFWYHYLLRL